jgi:hypothetical protein
VPRPVKDERLNWDWSVVSSALNHYSAVRCDRTDKVLALNEGQAMVWSTLDDSPARPTTLVIADNVHHIVRFTKRKPTDGSEGDL